MGVVFILGCLTFVFWHSFIAHTIFGALLLLTAVHNGSTYTFRVFALRYAASLINDNAAVFGYAEDPLVERTPTAPVNAYEQLKDVEDVINEPSPDSYQKVDAP